MSEDPQKVVVMNAAVPIEAAQPLPVRVIAPVDVNIASASPLLPPIFAPGKHVEFVGSFWLFKTGTRYDGAPFLNKLKIIEIAGEWVNANQEFGGSSERRYDPVGWFHVPSASAGLFWKGSS